MRIAGFELRRAERRSTLENPTVSLRDPAAFRSLFGLNEWLTAAGITVTAEAVMGIPAFAAGVNFLAGTMASLPLHEFRRGPNGRERVDTGMLAGILSGTVNDDCLTSWKWRKNTMVSVFLTGAGRTYAEKNPARQTVNLWPLETRNTVKERVAGRTVYRYRDGSNPVITYRADEVVDVTWADKLDGVSVFNPLERFRDTFGLALAVQRYGAKFFQNGGVPPLALKGPLGSPGATARAKTDIGAAVTKANRAGDPILAIPDGYELVPVGFDPEKGQLVELQRFLVEEFARILGLPPVFLQDLTHGTFSNTEQQDLLLVKHTVTHWCEQWEQAMNAVFYGPRQTSRYVEYVLDAILRGDLKSRIEAWARAIQTAQATPNEARRAENRPDDPDGDRLLIQGATVPLAKAGTLPPPANPVRDPADEPPKEGDEP